MDFSARVALALCLALLVATSHQGKIENITTTDDKLGFTYELTEAQKFWHFLGPAFKYPRSIKLMSDRLPNSKTMVVSLPLIRGGDSWNLTLDFVVKGEEKQHGEGFGIWISQKDVFQDILEFVSEAESEDHVLGMGGNFEGFGIGAIINKTGASTDTHYVSRSYKGKLSSEEFLHNSKTCKRTIQFNGRHTIVLRYRLGALSFYKMENGVETLCNSVSIPIPKFHIVLTGSSQKKHSLSIEFSRVSLETSTANSIKVKQDEGFGNMRFSMAGYNFMKHFHEFREFEEKKFSLYTKKFGKLLKTSNRTKLVDSIYKTEASSYKRISESLQLISLMANDLRSMVQYLDSHEQSSKSILSSNIQEVFKWISSMDVIYDQIETDIDHLLARVNAFQLEAYVGEVSDRIQKSVRATMDYDFLTSAVFEQAHEVSQFIKRMNDVSLNLKSKSSSMSSSVREKVSRAKEKGGSNSGTFLLLVVLIGIAGYIYFRINRITKKSHHL